MKQETTVSLEISEVLAMGMGLETLGHRLGKCHRLSAQAADADTVEMNGMVLLILEAHHDHRVPGNVLLHRYVDTEKKPDDQKTDQDDRDDLMFFMHGSAYPPSRINEHSDRGRSVLLFIIDLGDGKLKIRDPLILQGLFFCGSGGSLDAPFL